MKREIVETGEQSDSMSLLFHTTTSAGTVPTEYFLQFPPVPKYILFSRTVLKK